VNIRLDPPGEDRITLRGKVVCAAVLGMAMWWKGQELVAELLRAPNYAWVAFAMFLCACAVERICRGVAQLADAALRKAIMAQVQRVTKTQEQTNDMDDPDWWKRGEG
jgi:hypothetical protein